MKSPSPWLIRICPQLGMLLMLAAAPGCCCHWSCWCSNRHDGSGAASRPTAAAAPTAGAEVQVQFGGPGGEPVAETPGNVNVFGEMRHGGGGGGAAVVRPVVEPTLRQHTFPDQGYDADVSVDPTGRTIAFASTRDSQHPAIYVQPVDGPAAVQLTSGADDAYPAFSPDGKQIAFASTRAGAWQIFVMDADGKNVRQVTSGTAQAVHPTWSPDGARLAYCSLNARDRQWELWTVTLATGERHLIGYGLFPSWSPARGADGVDRIAFQRPRERGTRLFTLWTLELNDGQPQRVTEMAVSTNAALLSPAWSPDGRRVAFASVMEPGKDVPLHARGRTNIWTMNADGSDRRRITDGVGTNLTPGWSRDGRIYFVSDRAGNECIWSAGAEPAKVITVDVKD